jgi:hypothetical protein
MSGCPNGWIVIAQTPSHFPPTTVYYFSQTSPGSYQISVKGQIMNDSQQVTNQGNMSAMVTVTAQ